MKKEQEIIHKEIWRWDYFPEKDLRKIKPKIKEKNIITKVMIGFIKFLVPEVAFNMNGFYKVRYFEIINKRNGKVRLLKAIE